MSEASASIPASSRAKLMLLWMQMFVRTETTAHSRPCTVRSSAKQHSSISSSRSSMAGACRSFRSKQHACTPACRVCHFFLLMPDIFDSIFQGTQKFLRT